MIGRGECRYCGTTEGAWSLDPRACLSCAEFRQALREAGDPVPLIANYNHGREGRGPADDFTPIEQEFLWQAWTMRMREGGALVLEYGKEADVYFPSIGRQHGS